MTDYTHLHKFVKDFVEKMNIEKTDENIKIIQDFFGEIMQFTAKNIIELINEELDIKENEEKKENEK